MGGVPGTSTPYSNIYLTLCNSTAEPTSRKEVIGGRQQLGRKALKRILSTKRAVGGIHAGILVRFGYVNVQVLLNIIALLATRGSSAARRCTTRTRAPQLHVSSVMISIVNCIRRILRCDKLWYKIMF